MSGLDWPAITAGTVAAFLFGWAWYSPRLLGRRWAEGSRVNIAEGGLPAFAMASQIAGLLALALVIGVTATTDALGTAILAILAAAVLVVSNGAFTRKSGAALAIDGGYILLAGVLMIAAQGIL